MNKTLFGLMALTMGSLITPFSGSSSYTMKNDKGRTGSSSAKKKARKAERQNKTKARRKR